MDSEEKSETPIKYPHVIAEDDGENSENENDMFTSRFFGKNEIEMGVCNKDPDPWFVEDDPSMFRIYKLEKYI